MMLLSPHATCPDTLFPYTKLFPSQHLGPAQLQTPAARSQNPELIPMSMILTLSCRDRPGIVAAVSGFLAEHRFNIRDSAQFGDAETGLFFMRVSFDDLDGARPVDRVREAFATIAGPFAMPWEIPAEGGRSPLRPEQ